MSVIATNELASAKRPDPLTFSKKGGEPYTRFADVEQQILEVSVSPIGDWGEIVFGDLSRWKSQTLIYLARHATADERLFGKLIKAILARASKKLGYFTLGLDPTTVQQIDTAVSLGLTELIMAETPTKASEYLEIDFNGKVEQLVIRAKEKFDRHPAPHLVATASTSAKDPLDAVEDAGTPDPLSALVAKTGRRTVRRLLKAVTDGRHRKAFILRKMRDWPMYNEDSMVPSVLRHFGLEPNQRRTVQYWIERAEEQMREAYGEQE